MMKVKIKVKYQLLSGQIRLRKEEELNLKPKTHTKKYKSEDKKMKFLKVELTKLSCNKDSFKYDHKEEFSPIKAFNEELEIYGNSEKIKKFEIR